jgi:DNA replication and repair protein RecF
LTVITGENGSGKTSLLEAIGYVSTLQSFRKSPREALVRNGAKRAYIRASIDVESREHLVEIEITPDRRDVVLHNKQRIARADELLEALTVTVFTPDDLRLVKGGPAERRDYLDDLLEAANPRLAGLRRNLERILRQRTSLLRQASGRLTEEIALTLDVWDDQLASTGEQLVTERESIAAAVEPIARDAFSALTRVPADLELSYRRSFVGTLAEALVEHRLEDVRRATTGIGPHHDDLIVSLDGLDARTRLSQGRQRATTLALRLGAHQLLTQRHGTPPVLLLDDAFSELDEPTTNQLVHQLPAGQAILTTAGPLPQGLRTSSPSLRLDRGAFVG